MKFENIRSHITSITENRYVINDNADYENELFSLANIDLKNKWIFRIKRMGSKINSWKTLVFIEMETDDEENAKIELKRAVNWIALIKESLLGEENTDLYMFLAFSDSISEEECLRIEATEQFCRKYVLLPDEEISDFLNRTFLQKLLDNVDTTGLDDPIERSFCKTAAKYNWLTPEIKKEWMKAFFHLSGSELSDAILKGEI
jgi:hypothetical protein